MNDIVCDGIQGSFMYQTFEAIDPPYTIRPNHFPDVTRKVVVDRDALERRRRPPTKTAKHSFEAVSIGVTLLLDIVKHFHIRYPMRHFWITQTLLTRSKLGPKAD